MTKTREEFIRRWRTHLAGLALFGVASECRDGPMQRASKILDIPGEVERLLGVIYDDLAGKKVETAVNGVKTPTGVNK